MTTPLKNPDAFYMGGLVSTLRDIAKNGGLTEPNATLMSDAADEIDKLRAEIDRLRREHPHNVNVNAEDYPRVFDVYRSSK
jgi:hypothetical protein